ncbi:hypothetical protein AB0N99_27185 [Streptomyces sp. NPDC093272]|uniref:hypothetical protein n=1 Tax=Streptomyces sp. NPDC093272 TaxID=3154981 RepID=UPI00343B0BC9
MVDGAVAADAVVDGGEAWADGTGGTLPPLRADGAAVVRATGAAFCPPGDGARCTAGARCTTGPDGRAGPAEPADATGRFGAAGPAVPAVPAERATAPGPLLPAGVADGVRTSRSGTTGTDDGRPAAGPVVPKGPAWSAGPANGRRCTGRSRPDTARAPVGPVPPPLARAALDAPSRTACDRVPMNEGFCQVGSRPPNPESATGPPDVPRAR